MRKPRTASKLITHASSNWEKKKIAWFGEIFQKNPLVCQLAVDLLFAFDAVNHLEQKTSTLTAHERVEKYQQVKQAGIELLLLAKDDFKGNGSNLRDLADALQRLADPADAERFDILGAPDAMRRAGVKSKDAKTFQEVMKLWGHDLGSRQTRRMLSECGIDWQKGKAGRRSGS